MERAYLKHQLTTAEIARRVGITRQSASEFE